MPRFVKTALYSTADLSLTRVACNGDDGRGPRDERADGDAIVVVLRGRFVLSDRRTRSVISPCRAWALRAGDTYTITHPHGEGDVCLAIHGSRVRTLVDDRATYGVPASGYVRLWTLLRRLAGDGPPECLGVEETLALALAPHGRPSSSRRDRAIAEAIAYAVDLRFDERLALAHLAAAAGVTVFHACHAFRRAMNTSIHRYQRDVRLRHALALLRDTSWPLARIAVDAGFANQGHFGNVFRRRFGATPAQARTAPTLGCSDL